MNPIFELDLLRIARARQHAAIAALVLWVLMITILVFNMSATTSPLAMVLTILYLGAIVWVIVASILLQVAMGIGVPTMVLTALANLILPMFVSLSVVSQATTALRLAGAKPGLLGMKPSERDKITPGHCRGCGYSREGIGLLAPCPECRRVPQVI